MAGRTIPVDVVTPERRVWKGSAEVVIAKGSEGELGILPGHAPLITALRDGVLVIRRPGGAVLRIACESGFLEVTREGVTILSSSARLPEDVDVERELERLEQ